MNTSVDVVDKRAVHYGPPEQNFERIRLGWKAIFGCEISLVQVALAMDWVKTTRLIVSPTHGDSWLDKFGYTAIGEALAFAILSGDRARAESMGEADDDENADRTVLYGPPAENFERIALGWEAIFGCSVTVVQVGLALDWVATSRLIASPDHVDSWRNKFGYTAIGEGLALSRHSKVEVGVESEKVSDPSS